jgi:hypothetical protein
MGLNSRYQFVLLYTVGWDRITAAAADLNHAIEDGAFRVGEEAGLPLHRFNLEDAPAAHAAVERAADKLPGLGHRFEENVGVAEGVALDLRQRFPVGGVLVNQRDVLHASLLSIVWLLSEVGEAGDAFSTSREKSSACVETGDAAPTPLQTHPREEARST